MMENFIFALVIIGFIVLLYFGTKWHAKQSLLNGNPFAGSATGTKLVQNIQQEELKAREERLMRNSRYKILKGFLNEEVSRIQSMTLEVAREKIPNGTSQRIVENPSFNVVIKLYADLKYNSSASVKVTVYPKRILGFISSLEEWVEIK
jgi:hypothetical protein